MYVFCSICYATTMRAIFSHLFCKMLAQLLCTTPNCINFLFSSKKFKNCVIQYQKNQSQAKCISFLRQTGKFSPSFRKLEMRKYLLGLLIRSCLSKTPNFPSFCTGRSHSLESCFFCSQVNQLTNFSSLLLCCRRIFLRCLDSKVVLD